jgi:hypothetical protein
MVLLTFDIIEHVSHFCELFTAVAARVVCSDWHAVFTTSLVRIGEGQHCYLTAFRTTCLSDRYLLRVAVQRERGCTEETSHLRARRVAYRCAKCFKEVRVIAECKRCNESILKDTGSRLKGVLSS